jgi:hypothetical protein
LPLAGFFQRVRTKIRGDVHKPDGLEYEARQLVLEGSRLGVAPVDLLLGILQPALYEAGVRWEHENVSFEEGLRLSMLCEAIVEVLLAERPQLAALRNHREPLVLLAGAPENQHTLGLQIAEFVLLSGNVPVVVAPRGTSATQLAELALTLRPQLVGISVALPSQLASAEHMLDQVQALPSAHRPQLCIGGYAARVADGDSFKNSRYPLLDLAEIFRRVTVATGECTPLDRGRGGLDVGQLR